MINTLHKITYGHKLKVAAYARISKDKTDLESSLESQIRYYTTLISNNTDWEFAGIYADDGISGATIKKRNQFQLMLTKAFAKEIDIILVKSISRFARNVIDLLSVIQELRDSDIEVYFEKENISTFDTKSDNYLTLYSKFAEEELRSMSNNVNWTVQQNMRKGKYFLNAAQLFGFMFDENRNVVINEKEAKWVRIVFEMYSQGHNSAEIADLLERNGVKTLTGLERWSASSIRRIIRNEKYCGDVLLQKTFTENPLTQRRIINHGEKEKYLIENAIPSIVSKELWMKCQERMKQNAATYHIGNKKCANLKTAFTGFGFCPYCRNHYFRKFNRKTEMLYCISNKNRYKCAESESVFIDDLKHIIPILVKKLKDNESELRKALIEAFYTKEDDSLTKEIAELDTQISCLRSKLDEYVDLSGPAFESIKEEIRKQINELSDKKVILENDRLMNVSPEGRANSIIKELRKFPEDEVLEDYDFRKLFKQMIVVNRDRLIFVLGSESMDNIPYNPNAIPMTFIERYDHKVRSTTTTCYFGIYINK